MILFHPRVLHPRPTNPGTESIETGRYEPSLPLAFKIAELFGEPIESLFFPDAGPSRDHGSPT